MDSLEVMIEQAKDAREVKRAVSVKMGLSGLAPAQICQCLQVSPQYVSKWKGGYDTEGVAALELRYRGSESYLSAEQQREIAEWIGSHETLTVAEVRDYVEASYGVRYRSKQSYYTLLEAGGMSYHRTEKANPKHDSEQVRERRVALKKTGDAAGRDCGRGADCVSRRRMSLIVGRCLWPRVGETQYAGRSPDEQPAPAADVLRRAQPAHGRGARERVLGGEWGKHGGLYPMVSKPVSGQAVVIPVGWSQLSPGGRDAGVSDSRKCGGSGGRVGRDVSAVCSQRPGTEPGRRPVAQGEELPPQTFCAQQNVRPSPPLLPGVPPGAPLRVRQIQLVLGLSTTELGKLYTRQPRRRRVSARAASSTRAVTVQVCSPWTPAGRLP